MALKKKATHKLTNKKKKVTVDQKKKKRVNTTKKLKRTGKEKKVTSTKKLKRRTTGKKKKVTTTTKKLKKNVSSKKATEKKRATIAATTAVGSNGSNEETTYCNVGQSELFEFLHQFLKIKLSKKEQLELLVGGEVSMQKKRLVTTVGQTDVNINCNLLERFLPHFSCFRGWHIARILGQGSFGTVLLLTNRQNQFRAVKLQFENAREQFMKPETEIKLQQEMARRHLAPAVICKETVNIQKKRLHVFVMDTVDKTLKKYIQDLYQDFPREDQRETRVLRLQQILRALMLLLLEMKKLKFTHGDFHTENLMLKKVDGKYQLYMIDFGQSSQRFNDVKVDVSQFLRTLKDLKVRVLVNKGTPYQTETREPLKRSVYQFFETRLNRFVDQVWGLPIHKFDGSEEQWLKYHKAYEKYMGL